MNIKIGNITGYDTRTNLLSASLSNAFTGINAIARLVPDRRQLQSGNYRHLLKEYYSTVETAKPSEKLKIYSEVKKINKQADVFFQWDSTKKLAYDSNAQYINFVQSGQLIDSFV